MNDLKIFLFCVDSNKTEAAPSALAADRAIAQRLWAVSEHWTDLSQQKVSLPSITLGLSSPGRREDCSLFDIENEDLVEDLMYLFKV